ncbi:ABC transporter substrate-binding protein [Agarivorans sp. 1_MG-2023]|uniref:substrate-binding periplasmic protein n=1 Tax=Agarivorans sp. 1_MG-2023 TaxID=3062634 RepID=UPI0026E27F29|nr:transporter substrate-binding domain-containing protein [Agarivorans sp. 1_MG-2023]MDO6762730.1 transporter substrate-binding domain-containing protein [Agarivorans sp. 1_MG-2023]
MKNLVFYLLFCLMLSPTLSAKTYRTTQVISGPLAEMGQALLIEAYYRAGERVVFELLPSANALEATNSGEYDAEMFRIDNLQTKYANLIQIPTSYLSSENVVFTRLSDLKVEGYESLKPYSIAYRSSLKAAEIATLGFPKTSQLQDLDSALRFMSIGRADLVVEERWLGLKRIKALKLNNVSLVEPPVDQLKLYHYVHKDHVELAAKLDEAFKQMLKDGSAQSIIESVLKNVE